LTASPLRVIDLRCEYLTNPLGLEVRQPRLSWRLAASARGARQTAYQVRVASDPRHLSAGRGDLWDSGQVASDQSLHRVYQGAPLASRQRACWQVRIWDEHGHVSEWSEAATWEMGLLNPSDWQAAWITPDPALTTPCPRLRATFKLDAPVQSARAYVTSRGLYALELNGQPASDWLFTPGWTAYRKRLQYQTYDITALLQPGPNAIGVTLADGWFRGRLGPRYGQQLALLAQLVITYADGRVQVVASDPGWQAAAGPILKSDIYDGEDYDARLEQPGWSTSGHDAARWTGVQRSSEPAAALVAQMSPPVRRMNTLRPHSVQAGPQGEWIVDLGQNMVGWVRLRARGPAGTTIVVRHAEILDQTGGLYLDNIRGAQQTNRYTLSGQGDEIFEPHFTWQGFRYVAVTGYPGLLIADDITGVVVHSDLKPTGSFECSHPLINQLQHNILWGQKGNFLDVPTDCPQRDERLGWTGDAQVFVRTAAFNMDVAAFMTKWLRDLAADQLPDGSVPFVIPDAGRGAGATGWGDAAVICPWTLYQLYGDERLLAEQYASMQAWVGYVRQQAGGDYIWDNGFTFGDWLAVEAPDPQFPNPVTDKALLATAFFAYCTGLLAQVARRLGRSAEAAEYTALREAIVTAFNREFVTPNGRLAANTQTAYVLALQFDLLPAELRPEAARRLAADIHSRDNHLSTGFLGTSYLCHVLSDNGYLDLAYALLEQEAYPSWLYPVTLGATTSWERWDNIRPDGSLQTPNANSFNHYAFGHWRLAVSRSGWPQPGARSARLPAHSLSTAARWQLDLGGGAVGVALWSD
jgi:alpha-L-rhamnosidase